MREAPEEVEGTKYKVCENGHYCLHYAFWSIHFDVDNQKVLFFWYIGFTPYKIFLQPRHEFSLGVL